MRYTLSFGLKAHMQEAAEIWAEYQGGVLCLPWIPGSHSGSRLVGKFMHHMFL